MNYLRKYLLNLYMYYYHYLHQKYKEEKDVEENKGKFENPCLYFFYYIYNLFS